MKRSQQHSYNPYENKSDTASNEPPSSSSSSSPTSSTSKLETDQVEKKWRPFDIFTWGVTNSPRLIGWNDEDFRKIVEEHRKQRLKDPSIPNVEETGFGLMGMLGNALKEAVYKKTDFDDLKSDLKKIEDSTSNTSSSSATVGTSGSSPSLSLKDLSSDEKSPKQERRKDSSSIDFIGSSVNLKDMKIYQNVLSTIKYQRDTYIMGAEYAGQRKAEREQMETLPTVTAENGVSDTDTVERSSHQTALHSQDHPIQNTSSTSSSTSSTSTGTLSYKNYLDRYPNAVVRASSSSSSSLANTQLTGLLGWFIPSQTMHHALLPTVLWTIAPPTSQLPEGGPLRKQINRSVCDLIPLSQDLLDATMKTSILWVLSDESWRESVKGSSRNYLSSTDGRSGITDGSTSIHPSTSSSSSASHHDTSSSLGSGSGGRVIITKTIRMNR